MKDILNRVSIVLLLLLSLSLISCFKWDNPYDADNISSQLITPGNLRADAITETLYKLSWVDRCDVEEGFKIDRKDGNGSWQIGYATVGKNVVEYSIDLSGISPENIYIKWRVRAYHQNYVSGYSNEALLEPNTVANPVFIPAGATYNNDQTVTISTATLSATIRYTTDNSEPGFSSPLYNEPILVNANTTIKAKAFKAGWKTSSAVTETYNMAVSTPVFSLAAGTYTSDQSLTITCATSGAKIHYTKDGSEPTENSDLYSSAINVNANMTVKAKVFRTGWNPSTTVLAAYNFQVATPTFSLAAGTYTSGQTLSITCSTSGAKIRYTKDGSEPSESSALYSSAINVNANTTVKAKAFRTGWNASSTVSAVYSFQVAKPTFNPPAGSYATSQSVAIACTTNGVTIRYNLDGSDPTENSALYSSPITVTELSTTIKSKAFKANWSSSATAIGAFNITPSGFIAIQGGTFDSGTSDVTISSFYLDKYEVTQESYQAVMGINPATGYGVGSNYPIYNVSWFNAIEYCNRRSLQEGITPCYSYLSSGQNPAMWPNGWNTSDANHTNVSCNWTASGYRLPTEMEWMYAARGGTQTHNYTYSGSNSIDIVAWYYSNSGSKTHIVGDKNANELGMFDMSGNVNEWVWDIFGSYPIGNQTNPTGATSGSYRLLRSGGWNFSASYCIVSVRHNHIATYSYADTGFRVCRAIP